MKLISMTDFVLKQSKTLPFVTRFKNCDNYAKFLKKPLTLGMFVPCDDNENVLFDGFQWNEKGYVYKDFEMFDEERMQKMTIEDLIPYNLTLTKEL